MDAVKKILAVAACAAVAALLASCATVNRLDSCDFEGSTLAADMTTHSSDSVADPQKEARDAFRKAENSGALRGVRGGRCRRFRSMICHFLLETSAARTRWRYS